MSDLVYLIRHGDVVGSETRRFIGHLDVELSPLGERQLAALGRRLAGAGLAGVYCSDLARSRRSADLVGAPHGVTPVPLTGLREFAMGEWEGLTADEIRARDPLAFARWMGRVGEFQFPGGECLAEVAARAWRAFADIVAAHSGPVAVVAHGGPNRALLCLALGIAPSRILSLGQDYGALSVLERRGGRWRLVLLNHREPALSS